MHPACLVLLSLLLTCTQVSAQTVRRCISQDGVPVYTDKRCEQLDAYEEAGPVRPVEEAELAPATQPGEAAEIPPLSSYGPVNEDCPRTPERLREMLERQLAERDINGLAGLYHWLGMGTWGARSVMDRLEYLASRAQGPVELRYPEAAFVVFDPEAWPDLPPEDPIGIRIAMGGADAELIPDAATVRTIHYAGCWWIHF